MFDAEKLITLVRDSPAVWQGEVDRMIRDRAWETIGKGMDEEEWSKLTRTERDARIRFFKNKWRNVRDNYRKYLSQDKTLTKKRKYVYADLLTFLLPHMSVEYVHWDRLSDFMDEEDTLKEEPDIPIKIENVEPTGDQDEEYEAPQKKLKYFSKSSLDGDKSFLLSILPDMKKLSYEQNIDFRLYTLNFFKNAQKCNSPSTSTNKQLEQSDSSTDGL